jgi:hypothetical protein
MREEKTENEVAIDQSISTNRKLVLNKHSLHSFDEK